MTSNNSDKVFLIFDTNIIRINEKASETFDEFYIHRYDDIQKLIDSYELSNKVFLLMPEIVLLELVNQKKSKLNKWINTITDYSKNFSEIKKFIDKTKTINVDNHIEKIKNEKLSTLEIIPIPSNKELLFDNILERCLSKNPPFKGDSDKGFKDSLLFLSLLHYAKDFQDTKFVLFSKDSGFSDEKQRTKLEKEFSETGNSLEIRDDVDVEGYLKNLFGVDFEFQDFISEDLIPSIEEEISNYKKIRLDRNEYDVNSITIDTSSTYQQEISKERIKIVFVFHVEYMVNGEVFRITDLNREFTLNKKERQIISKGDYNYELL